MISDEIGIDEYQRLMSLSLHDFDQTSSGFRSYSDNYNLVSLIIPEYIEANNLSDGQARNINWHLGQIHAFNGSSEVAIDRMKKSLTGGSPAWKYYVIGSIAFLEKDRETLQTCIMEMQKLYDPPNIEILERFLENFEKDYREAYQNF